VAKPGRKPLMEGQATGTVTVRLPYPLHDDACKLALKQGVSVSALLREGLQRILKDQHGACLWL
jgi:predicted HicB family RNase H-like nuclease